MPALLFFVSAVAPAAAAVGVGVGVSVGGGGIAHVVAASVLGGAHRCWCLRCS